MEITFESKAYKELDNKITAIADYIFNHAEMAKQSEEDMWVDSYEVCTFLKISEKTLQRLRVSGTIAYSNIRGRYFYKVSEIRRMLEERLIRSNKENIDTSTPTGKLMLTMIGAINEFERMNLLERQREGIALAVQEGKYKGRKEVRIENFASHYERYMRREVNKAQLAKELNISRPTLDKLIREHEETLGA